MITALLLKYWKPLVGIALILAAWGALSWWGHTKYRDGVADQKATDQKVFDKLADLTRKTEEAIARRESEIRGLLDSSNKAREEGIAHAVEEQQRIVAGVRDGSLRLREQWRGCEAALAVSRDASSVGTGDDAADLRATGAASIIRALDDADVQVAELQRYAVACQANGKKLE